MAKLTFEIFGLGNSVKIPDFWRFNTLGTLILNGLVVVSLVPNVPPSLIPETVCVEANVKVFPLVEIFVTLLKTGSVESAPINAIIESVLIPTLPAKLRFIAVAAVPTILIWSDGEKPGNTRSYNTVSAANVDIPADEKLSCRIYLISSVVYETISLIDTVALTFCSVNFICSPFINVPVVCDTVNSLAPVVPLAFAR